MVATFWKMHGASNDFILIDDRQNIFPDSNQELINNICSRRTGIGCEGLILIRTSNSADFCMRFFNPNGNEADMCGNGARCVARLAHDLNITAATMKFETRAGIISAEVNDKSVKLQLPPATNYQQNKKLSISNGEEICYDFINTGVPHAVVQTENLENYPVTKNGYAIIKHATFAPNETNVNFAQVCSNQSINIRTYERGVEGETLACGTGTTATAITMALRNLVKPPVSITAASGDILIVDFNIENNMAHNITLTGPATHVFTGEIELDHPVKYNKIEPAACPSKQAKREVGCPHADNLT